MQKGAGSGRGGSGDPKAGDPRAAAGVGAAGGGPAGTRPIATQYPALVERSEVVDASLLEVEPSGLVDASALEVEPSGLVDPSALEVEPSAVVDASVLQVEPSAVVDASALLHDERGPQQADAWPDDGGWDIGDHESMVEPLSGLEAELDEEDDAHPVDALETTADVDVVAPVQPTEAPEKSAIMPLFDNVPTQHAPAELRAALLSRQAGAAEPVRVGRGSPMQLDALQPLVGGGDRTAGASAGAAGKAEAKVAAKAEPKADAKVAAKAEPKVEPKAGPKADLKAEPKADDRPGAKVSTKAPDRGGGGRDVATPIAGSIQAKGRAVGGAGERTGEVVSAAQLGAPVKAAAAAPAVTIIDTQGVLPAAIAKAAAEKAAAEKAAAEKAAAEKAAAEKAAAEKAAAKASADAGQKGGIPQGAKLAASQAAATPHAAIKGAAGKGAAGKDAAGKDAAGKDAAGKDLAPDRAAMIDAVPDRAGVRVGTPLDVPVKAISAAPAATIVDTQGVLAAAAAKAATRGTSEKEIAKPSAGAISTSGPAPAATIFDVQGVLPAAAKAAAASQGSAAKATGPAKGAAIAPAPASTLVPVVVPAALRAQRGADAAAASDANAASPASIKGAHLPHSGATFVLPDSGRTGAAVAVEARRGDGARQAGGTSTGQTERAPARRVDRRLPPAATDGGRRGGSGPPSPPPGTNEEIEKRVTASARAFTLPALLDVLGFLDYRGPEIEFKGVLSHAHPGSLVVAVDFARHPHRRVCVSLNMGLLSAQSPLPSYFLKLAERLESEGLLEFLGFFDHHLIKGRAATLYPERDRTLFADWHETQSQLIQLIGLTAPSTLHWLFTRAYPELGIDVRRSTEQKPLKAEGAVLGTARLGEACAFGGGTSVPVGGLQITLYSEEPQAPSGAAWSVEASRRLNGLVFPVLGETDVYLTVDLMILEQTTWMQLEDERYLGFEPMWESGRGDLPSPTTAQPVPRVDRSRVAYRQHQVRLFSGPVKSARYQPDGLAGGGADAQAGSATSGSTASA